MEDSDEPNAHGGGVRSTENFPESAPCDEVGNRRDSENDPRDEQARRAHTLLLLREREEREPHLVDDVQRNGDHGERRENASHLVTPTREHADHGDDAEDRNHEARRCGDSKLRVAELHARDHREVQHEREDCRVGGAEKLLRETELKQRIKAASERFEGEPSVRALAAIEEKENAVHERATDRRVQRRVRREHVEGVLAALHRIARRRRRETRHHVEPRALRPAMLHRHDKRERRLTREAFGNAPTVRPRHAVRFVLHSIETKHRLTLGLQFGASLKARDRKRQRLSSKLGGNFDLRTQPIRVFAGHFVVEMRGEIHRPLDRSVGGKQ